MGLRPDSQEFSQFLRLAFLRSPNYAAGSAGWTINQDGSAEFNDVTIREGEIVGGTALWYSSHPPAADTLIASVSSAGGTDAQGNVYLSGLVAYGYGPPATAIQLEGEILTFWTATSQAGPWSALGQIKDRVWNEPSGGAGITLETGAAGQFTVFDASIQAAVLLEALAALSVTGGLTADKAAVSATSNQSLVTVTNGQASPANVIAAIHAAAAGDNALRLDVTGDTNARFSSDSTGLLRWGTGAATPDTHLFRAAAGQLAADGLVADVGGSGESWHAPAFANSWANSATGAALQYRKVAAPYNSIQWVGRVLAPTPLVAATAINAAIPSGYQPAHAQSVVGIDIASGAIVRFQMSVTGTLIYESGASAGDNIDITDGLVSLDA